MTTRRFARLHSAPLTSMLLCISASTSAALSCHVMCICKSVMKIRGRRISLWREARLNGESGNGQSDRRANEMMNGQIGHSTRLIWMHASKAYIRTV